MTETAARERACLVRQAYTFHLDPVLVARARTEIGERDVVRSIEAALAAALDYQLWVREVAAGQREVLNRDRDRDRDRDRVRDRVRDRG